MKRAAVVFQAEAAHWFTAPLLMRIGFDRVLVYLPWSTCPM
jgi:hypothetical protein